MVVADGAGSAARAEDGARLVVEAVLSWFEGEDGDCGDLGASLRGALARGRDRLEQEAARLGADVDEFAATALIAVLKDGSLGFAHVGDGAIVAKQRDRGAETVSAPQTGEYANETVFLTSADALAVAHVGTLTGEFEGAALFSDGLQNLALVSPEATAHPPFFAPIFSFVADGSGEEEAQAGLEAALRSARILERAGDDVTLVVAAQAR